MIKSNIFSKFLGLALVIIGLSVGSCKSTKDAANAGMDTAKKAKSSQKDYTLDKALLWKVTGNGLQQASYVYGTIHMIGKDDYFLPEGTLSAIDDTDKMIFEINMENMTDMSNIMGLMNTAFMKDNLSLKDLLTTEEYQMVKEHFDAQGMPLMLFERMKPMFLTVFASGDMKPGDMQNGSIKSYEMEFMEMAKDMNKEMGGLETIEYQMSIFDSIPYKDQAQMLVESIQAGDQGGDQFDQMVEVYKQQDLDKMQEMFAAEEGGLEGYDDILVIQRNKNWIAPMETMMKEGPVFFAVGAGHLGGQQGVIHLLKDEGYTVKPVLSKKI